MIDNEFADIQILAGADMAKAAKKGKADIKTVDLDDRVAVIFPLHSEWADSTLKGQEGKRYNRVFADVIVMDGPISRPFREAGVQKLPHTIRSHMFTDKQITFNLRDLVGQVVLVRFNSQDGQYGGRPMGIEKVVSSSLPEDLVRAAIEAKRAHTPTDFLAERAARKIERENQGVKSESEFDEFEER